MVLPGWGVGGGRSREWLCSVYKTSILPDEEVSCRKHPLLVNDRASYADKSVT